MAQNFLGCDREQELLLPPGLRAWLPEEHLAWFVIEAVGEMDLSAFSVAYRQDGWGRAAHDPAMMVALFVSAYALGVRSSRGIERHRDDVAFRVITASRAPDHATIARFRVRHERAIAGLFGEVLALCAKAGLVEVGVVAVDGTKIAAAATERATRSYEQIANEILEEAARIDAAEDELYGEARGDELPEGLRTRGDRRQRLREAKRALEAERAAQARPIPRDRDRRLAEGKRRLQEDWDLERRVLAEHEAWRARGIASDGSRRMSGGHLIKPHPIADRPAGTIKVTDPDSRNLKTPRGWVQGSNAQAVVTARQIVIAADISTEGLDTANLAPMVSTACRELQAAGVTDRPGVVVADAGYRRTTRSKRSSPRASRRWSRPTPTGANNRGPDAAAASMTSCAASWPPIAARSSTPTARRSSSRSSARSRATAAPTASAAEAGRQSDPNGGC
jgi:transposase